jgi:ketosteroid isomerase-like protein
MRRTTLAALALVPTLALVSCTPAEAPPAPAVDTALEAETIMELDSEWVQRYADRDFEWITNLHAANAVLLPPGADIIEGNTAIGAAWEGMTEVFPQASWVPIMAKVSSSGDMAYVYGRATGTMADGTELPMKFMEVWVKLDGEWKVAADIFNANVQ